MKMLTSEITKLLDKLYNLRGENSVILSKMETERETAAKTKERTAKEKTDLQEKITSLTEEETILAEEGEKLIEALSKIKSDDFKFVLEKLNIDFNPDKLSEDISGLLPKTITKIQNEKESAKSLLVEVETEMDTAIATIEELAIRKDEALANQARLNEYFELALNGNINITRDSITSLLEKFNFDEDERREGAKILMFPEDALYEYENKIKNVENPGKSISDIFAEAKETAEERVSYEKNNDDIKTSPKEELINLLTELGFDYLEFTNNDIDKILSNYNEVTLRNNVKYAKDNNLNLDIFIDNVEFLYDTDFIAKINKLVEIGKDIFDIYLNPNILKKYNINDLTSTIDRFKDSGLDPKKVPLIAY